MRFDCEWERSWVKYLEDEKRLIKRSETRSYSKIQCNISTMGFRWVPLSTLAYFFFTLGFNWNNTANENEIDMIHGV